MKPDFSRYELVSVIAGAARRAFDAAIAEHADHTFFAFALTTLSGVQYIECSLNSDRNLEKILSRAGSRDFGGAQYYKWFPNEWGEFEYFAQANRDFFRPVQALLADIESETDAAAFAHYGVTQYPVRTDAPHHRAFGDIYEARRRYVFDSMVEALRVLDEAGCFGDGEARRKRIIFADVYDDSSSEELRALSADRINTGRASPELVQEFLRAE